MTMIIIILLVLLGNPLYLKQLGSIYNKRDTIMMTMLVSSIQILFQTHPMQTPVFIVLTQDPAFSSCEILCDSFIH